MGLSAGRVAEHGTGVVCVQVERGGEDAVFTLTKGSLGALGVADGVGGWAEDGIDAAAYSRAFVRACQEAIESTNGEEGGWCPGAMGGGGGE